eukprot:scaffold67467_cov63-Phaeocystis_antarctica.AAC.2
MRVVAENDTFGCDTILHTPKSTRARRLCYLLLNLRGRALLTTRAALVRLVTAPRERPSEPTPDASPQTPCSA